MNLSPTRPAALTPINRRKLSSDVTRALRQAILSGAYRPGDHLTEAQIAQEMHVSHGPVREAFRELAAEELIVVEPHRGAYIKTFTADDVREIYSMRSVLESAMVRLAIQRISAENIAELEALIGEMRAAARDEESDTLIELDLEFHRSLCALSGHRHLYEAWERLASPIRLFLAMAIPHYLGLSEAAESHAPIVRALRRRDADAAVKHMERGVLRVGESISEAMGSYSGAEAQRAPEGSAVLKAR